MEKYAGVITILYSHVKNNYVSKGGEQLNILYNEPETWRELKLLFSEILNAARYHASNGLQISTVRGNVNIDVLAEDRKTIPKSNYLIECKYWDSDIPQTIIHAFRTVVNDGAHHGLIIAKKDFSQEHMPQLKTQTFNY